MVRPTAIVAPCCAGAIADLSPTAPIEELISSTALTTNQDDYAALWTLREHELANVAVPTALVLQRPFRRNDRHLTSPNEKVEQLAANRLSIPQDAIASLLQRLVRCSWF
jgi:hypothetical protein